MLNRMKGFLLCAYKHITVNCFQAKQKKKERKNKKKKTILIWEMKIESIPDMYEDVWMYVFVWKMKQVKANTGV